LLASIDSLYKLIVYSRYANDVVAKCAFGVSVNSLKDPSNDFFRTGSTMASFTFWMQLKIFMFTSLPDLMKVRSSDEKNLCLSIFIQVLQS
jgi:hypothetical protein